MATSDAPRLAATAEALPPPGTGAAEPSSLDEPVEGQVAKAGRGRRFHAPIVRLRLGFGGGRSIRHVPTTIGGVGG